MSSDNEIDVNFNGNIINVKMVERDNKVLLYDGEYMIYEGSMNENNQLDGYGIIYYTPKIIKKNKKDVIGLIKYEGEFKNGFYDGEGKTYYENGNINVKGEFNNGEFIRGIEYYTNGKINVDSRIDCVVDNFKYTGYIKQYNDNETIKYEGNVVDHLYDGYGILYYPSGNVKYIGEWLNHRNHGYGITYYDDPSNSDKIMYKGEFKNHMRHGKGIRYTQDGTISGYFANDNFVEDIEEDIEKEIDLMIKQTKPTQNPTIDTKSIIESKLDNCLLSKDHLPSKDYPPSYDECDIKLY